MTLIRFVFFMLVLIVTSAPAGAQDYVVGHDDVLEVSYWRDAQHSAEVTVRPDGFVSLPLIGELHVAGATPAEVADRVRARAADFLQDPVVTVVIKHVNSRRVFITGEVVRPGAYPITAPTTVLQLIAMAGGLTDFADRSAIVIIRADAALAPAIVNYKQLTRLQNLKQNVTLRPGDTIVVR